MNTSMHDLNSALVAGTDSSQRQRSNPPRRGYWEEGVGGASQRPVGGVFFRVVGRAVLSDEPRILTSCPHLCCRRGRCRTWSSPSGGSCPLAGGSGCPDGGSDRVFYLWAPRWWTFSVFCYMLSAKQLISSAFRSEFTLSPVRFSCWTSGTSLGLKISYFSHQKKFESSKP